MNWQQALENSSIPKQPLVVIRPRVRVQGEWTLVAPSTYAQVLPYQNVTRVWKEYANDDGLTESGTSAVAADEFHYDRDTKTLTIAGSDPELEDYPGVTVEYELYISAYSFCGPRDPLDINSQYVEWTGGLSEVPMAQNGSAESLYGFYPLNQSSVNVLNGDGSLNSILHDSSFNQALVKAYIAVDQNVEKGMRRSLVRQVFLGFVDGMRWADERVQFVCTDFLKFFDRPYASLSRRFSVADFPNVEPGAYDQRPDGQEWFVRKVIGMVDGFRPVNIDYDAAPSTTNNRVWVTHAQDTGAQNYLDQTMDDAAANTATKTFFLDTPRYNVGDWVALLHASGTRYTEVETVDRAGKFITHEPLVRTVVAGEYVRRSNWIGRIIVEDTNGQSWWLRPFIDFTPYADAGTGVYGFTMADDWESALGFTQTPFNPEEHKVCVRVYGTDVVETYDSGDPVSSLVEQGNVAAAAVDVVHRLIRESGFDIADIDQGTFEDVESHAIGFAIPEQHDTLEELPTYKSFIQRILDSMLWRLAFVETNSQVKLGLISVGPFVAAADHEVNEQQHANLDYYHDYGDIYNRVTLSFGIRDEVDIDLQDLDPQYVVAENPAAKHLHFSDKEWTGELLQYDEAEAQEIANRLSYALGDRRGIYKMNLDAEFISRAALGVSVDLIRQHLPGSAYVEGTERTKQLMVIEVQKSTQGVSITLEDQKGIQDHSGEW